MHGAFMPPAARAEKSVYRIMNLLENEIWEIGDEYVARTVGKDIKVRADLCVSLVIDTGLEVVSDPIPHPRHANILGWPDERDEIRQLAVELADNSSLEVRP